MNAVILRHLLPFRLGNEISKVYTFSSSFQTYWVHLSQMRLSFEEPLLHTDKNKQQIANDLFYLLSFSIWRYLLSGNNDSGNVTGIIHGLWMMLSSFYSLLIRNPMTCELFNKHISISLMPWKWAVIHI